MVEQERVLSHQKALEEQVRQQQGELRQLTLDMTNAVHRQRQQMASILQTTQQILVSAQMKLNAWRTSAPGPAKVEEVAPGRERSEDRGGQAFRAAPAKSFSHEALSTDQ